MVGTEQNKQLTAVIHATACSLTQLTSSCFVASTCEGPRSSLTAFTWTEFTMPLALMPNLKDDSVSAALSKEGEQQIIKAVLAVPPKESCTAHNLLSYSPKTQSC